ncbi:MAG: glycosyltransferase family 2 protein, partial [Plesiomonas sp.]
MKNNPLISVLMPVYNCAEYVQDAINSILEQTHKNIELIVIDDGSNDQTRDKVKEIKDIDSRIILLEKEHGGIASCLNDGLEIAS